LDDKSIAGMAFNISNDAPVSVLQIVESILKTLKREDLKPVVLNQASREIQAQYLSSARMREILGWAPQYSLEQGLTEAAAWYGAHLARVAAK
jgi:CDP-glucose 4,6-dehydratase